MKHTSYVVVGMLAVIMIGIPGCDWLKTSDTASAEKPLTRILDLNTAELFHDAHIRGATHVEFDDIDEISKQWNKKSPLILYCSDYGCRTSHIAAKKLTALGFEDVMVYPGGIHEWYTLSKEDTGKYPIEGDAQLPFLEKNVEKVILKEEDGKVLSAQEVAQRLQEMHT
jgi:rhodanese-related sulfurtransferase